MYNFLLVMDQSKYLPDCQELPFIPLLLRNQWIQILFKNPLTSRNICVKQWNDTFIIFSISFHSPYYFAILIYPPFYHMYIFLIILPFYHFHSISTLLFYFILYISLFLCLSLYNVHPFHAILSISILI